MSFDHPVHVPGFKPDALFSRATVRYLDRSGPNGSRVDTLPLKQVWQVAQLIGSQPDDCAADVGDACEAHVDPGALAGSATPSPP